MKLFGGISINEDGVCTSVRSMHLQTGIFNTVNENIRGFGKIGYQRKMPVVSSFAELIGIHGYSEVKDESVGRIRLTKRPLDMAIAGEGYFQFQTDSGVQLTRDGRFKLDKDGYLLTLENQRVLSISGQPIKFQEIPSDLERIKVEKDGSIKVFYPETHEHKYIDRLSVVSNKGELIETVDIRQKYTEDSNVTLNQEIYGLMSLRRNFEANRQLYIIQNDQLSKTISELGRPQ